MLYHLALELRGHVSGFNVFSYVSTRAVMAALFALAIGLLFGSRYIRLVQGSGKGQQIRDDGPPSHLVKRDTPTMGGIVIIVAMLVSALLWCDLTNAYFWLCFAVVLGFAAIGFADDHSKINRGSPRGLSMRQKLALQSVLALAALLAAALLTPLRDHLGLIVPYWKDLTIPLGTAGFVALGYFVLVGSSNAVNLTDGLDGLAIMPCVLISGGLAVFAYVTGHSVFSGYLGLPHIPGVNELVIFCAALVGAGLAFLWFNAYPAEVFMGDTGSLSLGAALGMVAVIVRQELVFFVMSLVFVLEAISVMVQVVSFKLTGRRVFRMAPLHHHFELKGWRENQVVVRFWIITFILLLLGLSALKIR